LYVLRKNVAEGDNQHKEKLIETIGKVLFLQKTRFLLKP